MVGIYPNQERSKKIQATIKKTKKKLSQMYHKGTKSKKRKSERKPEEKKLKYMMVYQKRT